MIDAKIIEIVVYDIRFPTSLKRPREIKRKGKNTDPDYSCVYVIIKTDKKDKRNKTIEGYGLTSTRGRGNEFVVQVCKTLSDIIKDESTIEIYDNFALIWRQLTRDSPLRSLGPESGVIHLAAAAIINGLWDLWARIEGKPLWQLLVDMKPETLISSIDFSYLTEVMNEEIAMHILEKNEPAYEDRQNILKKDGYPAYVTTGCTYGASLRGHVNQKIYDLCRNFKKLDFCTFKVSGEKEICDSLTKCFVARKMIGWKKRHLMMDANQAFSDVTEIDDFINRSREKNLRLSCLEDLMSTDDYATIQTIRYLNNKLCVNAIDEHNCDEPKWGVIILPGETCANCVIFKQYVNMKYPKYWQINVARVGGVNEALIAYFLATLIHAQVWVHTNGVGLAEMAQHLQMWDSICISQSFRNRYIEFANQQHGYFENPVYIRNSCYMPPTRPGFSTKLKDKCIKKWEYPKGTHWRHLIATGRVN